MRRPFSLFDVDPRAGTVEIICKIVGTGTAALARAKAGEHLDFLGPLGSPFQIPAGIRQAWLVGGGVGIPPLYFLAKRLKDAPSPRPLPLPGGEEKGEGVEMRVFLGARTKGWLLCVQDFKKLGAEVHVATDDGTLGHRGSVVDLVLAVIASEAKQSRFKTKIASGASRPRNDAHFFICGPTPMMAAAAALARRFGIPAQVSLEERMGCAMGVCMGCCVEVTTEPANSHARFQRVCTEGPVFRAEEIAWRSNGR